MRKVSILTAMSFVMLLLAAPVNAQEAESQEKQFEKKKFCDSSGDVCLEFE